METAFHPDIETGRVMGLQTNDVIGCLEGKKVVLIPEGAESYCGCWCCSTVAGAAAGAILGVATFFGTCTVELFYCLGPNSDYCDSADNTFGVAALVGLGTALTTTAIGALCGPTCLSGRIAINLPRNHKNNLIQEKINLLETFKDRPLNADYFWDLYDLKWLTSEQIERLSFRQLREIKSIRPRQYKSLVLTADQWAPWKKIERLTSNPEKIARALSEEYMQNLVVQEPLILEELLHQLSLSILNDTKATEALMALTRAAFDTKLNDDTLKQVLAETINGGCLASAIRCQESSGNREELIWNKESCYVPRSQLLNLSDFFAEQEESLAYDVSYLEKEEFDLLIKIILEKSISVDQKNLTTLLNLGMEFQIPSIIEMCLSTIIKTYGKKSLSKRLNLLRRYPMISGSFRKSVDRDHLKHIGLFPIHKYPERFSDLYLRSKDLGLYKSKRKLIELLLNEVDNWKITSEDATTLVEKIKLYLALRPSDKKLKGKLKDKIVEWIAEKRDLDALMKAACNEPHSLLLDCLIDFINDKKNSSIVEGNCDVVQDAKNNLQSAKNQLQSDEQLFAEVKKWADSKIVKGDLSLFFNSVLAFERGVANSTEYPPQINKRLINAIGERLHFRPYDLKTYYEEMIYGDFSSPVLLNGLIQYFRDPQNAWRISRIFASPEKALKTLDNLNEHRTY